MLLNILIVKIFILTSFISSSQLGFLIWNFNPINKGRVNPILHNVAKNNNNVIIILNFYAGPPPLSVKYDPSALLKDPSSDISLVPCTVPCSSNRV